MLNDIVVDLVEPAIYLVLPQHRFFWLYLSSAVGIALVVCYLRQIAGEGRSVLAAIRAVFPRRIFRHPSALLDYRYVLVNHLLHTVVLAALIANTAAMTGGCLTLLRFVLGEEGLNATPGPVASSVFTICMLLAVDGGLFLAHWLQQRSRRCGNSTRCIIPPRC